MNKYYICWAVHCSITIWYGCISILFFLVVNRWIQHSQIHCWNIQILEIHFLTEKKSLLNVNFYCDNFIYVVRKRQAEISISNIFPYESNVMDGWADIPIHNAKYTTHWNRARKKFEKPENSILWFSTI